MNKLLKNLRLIVKLYKPFNKLTSGNIYMLHNKREKGGNSINNSTFLTNIKNCGKKTVAKIFATVFLPQFTMNKL